MDIATADTVKLLGVTINQRLTFGAHANNTGISMEGRLYGMSSLKRLELNEGGLIALG